MNKSTAFAKAAYANLSIAKSLQANGSGWDDFPMIMGSN